MNYEGLIPMVGGIYGYLLAIGYLPRNPKEPEKHRLWLEKFSGSMKILSPIVFFFGVLQFIGFL